MKIIALGNCCEKSRQNYLNAIEAAKICQVAEPVENLGNIKDIMKYGVMSTPALVIDGKAVSMGKMLSVEQIVKIIKEKQQ